MELQSLNLLKTAPRNIPELLDIDGAIRSILVISAYIDMDTIDAIVKHLHERSDDRTSPELWIYTDYCAKWLHHKPRTSRRNPQIQRKIATKRIHRRQRNLLDQYRQSLPQ